MLLLTVAVVSACTSATTNQSQPSNYQTASTDCRLVQHEMGETEICGQLQRIASLSPFILDCMLALGVQPIAHSDAAWNPSIEVYDNPAEQIPYLGQWVKSKPIPLGKNDSPSLEALANTQPDLILGAEYHKGEYSLMTQIAPTLLFNRRREDGKISWQNNIKEIALALDREAQAEELLTRHSQMVAAVREQLASVVATHPRMLVLHFNLPDNRIHSQEYSTAARLFQKVGFEIVSSENSSGLPEVNPSGGNPPISIEILPQIEADLIFVLVWADEDDKPQEISKQQWASNPVLQQVPAFKEGKIFFVDSYLWSSATRGPLTDELILEALPEMLLSIE
ncbi:MAG: iron-siderophore ABC transporter substrate-binding protein [Cyanobacteria bacterium P01_H01_bin.15]